MKEISRRAMSTRMEGMACGPVSTYAIDAEIVVEDDGLTVYLHAEWVDEVCDSIFFEATTESVYDAELELNKAIDGDMSHFQELIDKRDKVQEEYSVSKIFGTVDLQERYAEQYEQLLQMMQDVLDQDEIDFDIHELEYRDIEYDEDEDEEDGDEE